MVSSRSEVSGQRSVVSGQWSGLGLDLGLWPSSTSGGAPAPPATIKGGFAGGAPPPAVRAKGRASHRRGLRGGATWMAPRETPLRAVGPRPLARRFRHPATQDGHEGLADLANPVRHRALLLWIERPCMRERSYQAASRRLRHRLLCLGRVQDVAWNLHAEHASRCRDLDVGCR